MYGEESQASVGSCPVLLQAVRYLTEAKLSAREDLPV